MACILGISAYYHDSAAALMVDGVPVAAAQEERFTRIKHDSRFPRNSVRYCLDWAGKSLSDVDYVVFYEKPLRKFERLIETFVAFAPFGYRAFRAAIPHWVNAKLRTPKRIREGLGGAYSGPLMYTEHHESHAASAFFPSPFEQAAILTMDGVGEWATTCIGEGVGNKISITQEIRFPHSLGLLYSAFTYYLGFQVNSGEYKLMGLAPYGEPNYRQQILDHLIDLKPDGSFRLDMKYFNYGHGLTMTSQHFHRLFGGPPRRPESSFTKRHLDLAASIQAVAEIAMLRLANYARNVTGKKNLVLSGGVALNCVGNGRISREGPFESVWIQPASGDAGGALGAAQFVHYQLLDEPRAAHVPDAQRGSLLGPSFSDVEIQAELDGAKLNYTRLGSDAELCEAVAEMLDEQHVVGWFQGRMEFGPRALGARSILADARSPKMQSVINQKIKFRESFRPFAPMVMQEFAQDYFQMSDSSSPYMLLTAPVHPDLRVAVDVEETASEIQERLGVPRSKIPAVTHVDDSARVQTVHPQQSPLTHRLLQEFYVRTRCPVLVNTSFNVRGEPMVCSPGDAVRCFLHTDMDALAIGRFVIEKAKQDRGVLQVDRISHLQQFALD